MIHRTAADLQILHLKNDAEEALKELLDLSKAKIMQLTDAQSKNDKK